MGAQRYQWTGRTNLSLEGLYVSSAAQRNKLHLIPFIHSFIHSFIHPCIPLSSAVVRNVRFRKPLQELNTCKNSNIIALHVTLLLQSYRYQVFPTQRKLLWTSAEDGVFIHLFRIHSFIHSFILCIHWDSQSVGQSVSHASQSVSQLISQTVIHSFSYFLASFINWAPITFFAFLGLLTPWFTMEYHSALQHLVATCTWISSCRLL